MDFYEAKNINILLFNIALLCINIISEIFKLVIKDNYFEF